MTTEDDGDGSGRIAGLEVEEAVGYLVAEDPDRNPQEVRQALSYVTTDGVVDPETVDEQLSYLANVVATPENRTEFAGIELDEARAAAASAPDLDVVESRLAAFESRLESVEARAAELGPQLRELADAPEDRGLYDVAAGIRDLTEAANAAQHAADELAVDLEEFGRWLTNPEVRRGDLNEDVGALEESLVGVERTLEELRVAVADADADGRGGGGGGDGVDKADLVATWVDAALRQRVFSLLLADLRAELDDLRTWAAQTDVEESKLAASSLDDVAGRLDTLETRRERLGDGLDDVAPAEWHDRFGDRLAAFEADVEAFEPPVNWGEVQALQEEHREAFAELR